MKYLWLASFILITTTLFGQGFEMSGLQEIYRGNVGEVIKAPLKFKNTTDKTITLVIRKVNAQIGATQKNYYCLDNNCLDQKYDDILLKVEPGQTLSSLQITLEGGLAANESVIKYIVYNKQTPNDFTEFDINFSVEEKAVKQSIYASHHITLHDVYPNPVSDYAYVDYKILGDRTKARIIIHNILGNSVGEYELPVAESRIKIRTEELNAGIYFYTLYIDNEGVMTRKLVVKN